MERLPQETLREIELYLYSTRDRHTIASISRVIRRLLLSDRRWGKYQPTMIQVDALAAMNENAKTEKALYLNLPVSSGKTILCLRFARELACGGTVFIRIALWSLPHWLRELRTIFGKEQIPRCRRESIATDKVLFLTHKLKARLGSRGAALKGKIVLFWGHTRLQEFGLTKTTKNVLIVDEAHYVPQKTMSMLCGLKGAFASMIFASSVPPVMGDDGKCTVRGWWERVPVYAIPHSVIEDALPKITVINLTLHAGARRQLFGRFGLRNSAQSYRPGFCKLPVANRGGVEEKMLVTSVRDLVLLLHAESISEHRVSMFSSQRPWRLRSFFDIIAHRKNIEDPLPLVNSEGLSRDRQALKRFIGARKVKLALFSDMSSFVGGDSGPTQPERLLPQDFQALAFEGKRCNGFFPYELFLMHQAGLVVFYHPQEFNEWKECDHGVLVVQKYEKLEGLDFSCIEKVVLCLNCFDRLSHDQYQQFIGRFLRTTNRQKEVNILFIDDRPNQVSPLVLRFMQCDLCTTRDLQALLDGRKLKMAPVVNISQVPVDIVCELLESSDEVFLALCLGVGKSKYEKLMCWAAKGSKIPREELERRRSTIHQTKQ